MIDREVSSPLDRNHRVPQVAHALARAVRDGELVATDALSVIKHELRRLNTNKKQEIPTRSTEAQRVIDTYGAESVPNNNSPDALHADHVYPPTDDDLRCNDTLALWINQMPRLRTVVCVTAKENYRLQGYERRGITGPGKYAQAGVTFTTRELPWCENR